MFLQEHVENFKIKKEVSVNIENNLKSHKDKLNGNIIKICGKNEKEFELISKRSMLMLKKRQN